MINKNNLKFYNATGIYYSEDRRCYDYWLVIQYTDPDNILSHNQYCISSLPDEDISSDYDLVIWHDAVIIEIIKEYGVPPDYMEL